MPKIVLEKISKNYGKKTVIDDVSLEIEDGEFACLLGPPGAGKTTILRMIAGLVNQDNGDIYIGEKKVNNLSPAARDVAMVFQTFALYPHLTVFENIASPLRKKNLKFSKIKSKVQEVSEMLGITPLLQKAPSLLSGGERQRVAIGRALAKEPKVLLLDEPLSNLDAKLRLHMRAELRRLQRTLNITTVLGTPDELEALTMSDKVAVINEGKIIQHDTTDKIYDYPKNLFVAKFVGTPPMNTLKFILEKEKNKIHAKFDTFTFDLSKFEDRLKNIESGTDLLFGIRPTDIIIQENGHGKQLIEATVYTLEPIGAETVVNLKLGDNIVRTKIPASQKLDLDQKLYIKFNQDAIHLFDEKTEKAI